MATPNPTRIPDKRSGRKRVIILLAIGIFLLFVILVSQAAFNLTFLRPDTNQELLFFASLSALIFLLARNLLKLIAERRLGVVGSKLRTRIVLVGLMVYILAVICMFFFAYGLMNRSIDKWFSRPVEEVREDTAAMASLISTYATQNARSEALSIASSPETQRAFAGHSFSGVVNEFRRHEITLQGGFALAIADGNAEASFGAPAAWPLLRSQLPLQQAESDSQLHFTWRNTQYIVGTAPVGEHGLILVAMPLPQKFSDTVKQIEASEQRYFQLSRERKLVRRTYMGVLALLSMLVLFATTWLALFLSKLVTQPVAALAEATQAISRGRLDYRVEVRAADEIGDLVRSFNRMAEELELSRRQIEASSHELGAANVALEQRRRHIETILESIPTGVLSLDADRRVTHVNRALLRMFNPAGPDPNAPDSLAGLELRAVFPPEAMEDLELLLRRADRMGMNTSQVEMTLPRAKLNVAITVASLQHEGHRLGYVMVETVRTLVDEFATLARFPTARPQPANINAIVEGALAMFNGRLDNIQVRTRLGPDLPNVMADPEAVKRAIANLVDNAAEAMQHSVLREIQISTSLVASRDAIEVVVADTGHGVTQELKERLFLPYFSTKRRGTGLGLAIVNRIIEDHHGSIRVEENEPMGTKFIVELPVALEVASTPAAS